MDMPLSTLLLIIIFAGATPGIIYTGYLEKKGLPSKAIATFTAPDGTRRQTQMDVSWSWTVFIFRGWALAFRGQFMPFLIMMITGMIVFSGLGIISLITMGLGGTSPTDLDLDIWEYSYVSDYFTQQEGWKIAMDFLGVGFYLAVVNYYVAFANRERIKQYVAKGFDFSQSPNLKSLYEYIGYVPRTSPKDLAPNVKSGQAHDYVVPDAEAKKAQETKEAEKEDYSMLTINDLRLLLKSEGIPFTTTQSKEDLLELVDKHIVKKKKT